MVGSTTGCYQLNSPLLPLQQPIFFYTFQIFIDHKQESMLAVGTYKFSHVSRDCASVGVKNNLKKHCIIAVMKQTPPPPNTNTTTILPNCAQYLFISNPPLSNIEKGALLKTDLSLLLSPWRVLILNVTRALSPPLLHIGFTGSGSCEIFKIFKIWVVFLFQI